MGKHVSRRLRRLRGYEDRSTLGAVITFLIIAGGVLTALIIAYYTARR